MDEKLISRVADVIKSYLSEHPAAADTIEGIHEYWIAWGDIPEMKAVTEAALLHLEQAGFVMRTKAGNRDIWRRKNEGGNSLPA